MKESWPVVVNDDHIAKVKQLLAAGADVNRASDQDQDGFSALNLTFMWNDLSDPLQRLLLEADSSGATSQLKDLMEEFYGDGFYGVNYSCVMEYDGLRGGREYTLKTKDTDPKGIRLKEAIMLLAEYGAAEALDMQGSREQRPVPEWARRAFALGADLHKVKAALKA